MSATSSDTKVPAPPDLQHSTGGQLSDGLPQGGAAHPQLLGELHLVGELVPGRSVPSATMLLYRRSAVCWDRFRFDMVSLLLFLCAGGSSLLTFSLYLILYSQTMQEKSDNLSLDL